MNRFLALSPETPLVRYLDLPEGARGPRCAAASPDLDHDLRPQHYQGLDVGQEWAKLSEATAGLNEQGMIELYRVEQATLPALQRMIRTDDFHVFHFTRSRRVRAPGRRWWLEDDQEARPAGVGSGTWGDPPRVPAAPPRPAPRLRGCRGSATDPFAGAAQSLVQQGIPAVIAMQFSITDWAAILFAQEFYGAATGPPGRRCPLTERPLSSSPPITSWSGRCPCST